MKSELMKLFWLLENSGNIICQNKDTGAEYHELIRPVLEYMSRNLQEEICIEQLAGLVHLSKSHFMRCFKDTVGVGAMEHLTQLRISAACEALSNTQDKISDISYRCGYSNLSNFNRQFLKKWAALRMNIGNAASETTCPYKTCPLSITCLSDRSSLSSNTTSAYFPAVMLPQES